MMRATSKFVAKNPKAAVAIVLVITIFLGYAMTGFTGKTTEDIFLPDTETARADRMIAIEYPQDESAMFIAKSPDGNLLQREQLLEVVDMEITVMADQTISENFTDPDNGNQFVVEPLTVAPYSSPLPDQFQRIFAGLGMFFAIMAIMALGTEVVIDNLKVMIGLKSKVSASAALERMEKLLPGKLAGLGVGAVEQSQVKSLINDLKETIQPVEDVRSVAVNIQKGDFGEAYNGIVALVPAKGTKVAEDKLGELKDAGRIVLDIAYHLQDMDLLQRAVYEADEELSATATQYIYLVSKSDVSKSIGVLGTISQDLSLTRMLGRRGRKGMRGPMGHRGGGHHEECCSYSLPPSQNTQVGLINHIP